VAFNRICLDFEKWKLRKSNGEPWRIQKSPHQPVREHRPRSEDRRAKTTLKKLIVFDLDGTLAESKSSLDAEMSALLHRLLEIAKVAVISGGDWPQFEKQLLPIFLLAKAL